MVPTRCGECRSGIGIGVVRPNALHQMISPEMACRGMASTRPWSRRDAFKVQINLVK